MSQASKTGYKKRKNWKGKGKNKIKSEKRRTEEKSQTSCREESVLCKERGRPEGSGTINNG